MDTACLDARLLSILAYDYSQEDTFGNLLAMQKETMDELGEIPVPAAGDAWADVFVRPRLRLQAALARTAINTARFRMAQDYCLDLLTHENPPAFATLFSRFSIWGRAFGLRFMTTLLTFLWSLLFIVPGIIASYRYALAPYLMAENPDMDVMEAIARSKELMDGNKGRLFCLQLSFIGWSLLCVLTLGIGYLWLAPYQNAAEAAFYLEVTGRTDAMPRPDLTADAE